MVHQDIQLSQFLFNSDKSLVKLNDFNRAEFLLWDEDEEKYCLYHEGRGMGTVSFCPFCLAIIFPKFSLSNQLTRFIPCWFKQWRSAEEYFDRGLNEKVDVYSLGNNMFGVLLGVAPFWDVEHTKEIQVRWE